jgi:drug/metabolite transporter (DMT)-like permease
LHRSDGVYIDESSFKRSWLPAVVYGIALAGGDASFILATHRIPVAQANLISYLWPVMIVIFGAVIGLFSIVVIGK